jgi:heptosyltransferase III
MASLFYHTGALGDFITIVPAIQWYKKQNPSRKITLLGRPAIGKFALATGLISNWLDIDDPKYLPLFYDTFSKEAGKILAEFKTAVLFANDDSLILRNIEQSAIQNLLWQPPFPSSSMHVIDYHLSLFCDPLTLDPAERTPSIIPPAPALSESEKSIDLNADQPPIAIHPGSGSGKKNWPFDRFLSVADHFRTKKIPVVWIKGPAEESLHFPADDRIASNLELPVLAALLHQCRAYAGNDSGVTHLAAAVGCPTLAIFGPSDPAVWSPRGKKVVIVRWNDDRTMIINHLERFLSQTNPAINSKSKDE